MNENSLGFLNRMTAIFPRLTRAYRETVDYWSPDDPPVTIVYGEIGERIVEEFDAISPDIKQALFLLIEEGMASDDAELSAAIATGLIEGMTGKASSLGISWDVIRLLLGPLSKAHADAWLSS